MSSTCARAASPTREALVERLIGGGFLVGPSALAVSGASGGVSMLAVAGAMLAFVVAARVEFDMSGGFAVPTQLAFVPLLFMVPASFCRSRWDSRGC